MDNSYFVFKDKGTPIEIVRFHICSWEFKNETALIEFGYEIDLPEYEGEKLSLYAFVPWLKQDTLPKDLYPALKGSENSKFIFNEFVHGTDSLDGGSNKAGVVHRFSDRDPLCVLPVKIEADERLGILHLLVNLTEYRGYNAGKLPNIYFRYSLSPPTTAISTRKTGISKSTIIYDVKVNEQRNLPPGIEEVLRTRDLCRIESCFCLNVVPNKYELTFLDTAALKNVRTLEFDAFAAYLGDPRLKKDELIVIFNKKKAGEGEVAPSYSFFSIFYKERIGAGQFALAVLVNLVCGILLFWPAYKENTNLSGFSWATLKQLPAELYIATILAASLLLYFIAPALSKVRFRRKPKDSKS